MTRQQRQKQLEEQQQQQQQQQAVVKSEPLISIQGSPTGGSGSNGPLFYYLMPGSVPYSLTADGGTTVQVKTSDGSIATAQLVTVPNGAIQVQSGGSSAGGGGSSTVSCYEIIMYYFLLKLTPKKRVFLCKMSRNEKKIRCFWKIRGNNNFTRKNLSRFIFVISRESNLMKF